jgi:UDP-glucose 4-epimerase
VTGRAQHLATVGGHYAGKRVLVTGGLGFVGSNLARELVALGSHVTVVDALLPDTGASRANLAGLEDAVQVYVADVGDTATMAPLVADCDVVFNLAARTSHVESLRDPTADLQANAVSQISLLEICRRENPGARIVYGSTRQLYGRPQYLPVDERHPVVPIDPNAVSKYAGEGYHMLYGRIHGLPVCALRLTNTYGPRMRVLDARQNFVGLWLRLAVEGEELAVYGEGTQRRDLTYVDDAVLAFLLAGARSEAIGRIFNVGGDIVTLLGLAKLLVEVSGGGSHRLVPFPRERRAIDIGDYVGDWTRIRESLGWTPRVGLRDGLERSVAYLREPARRSLGSAA